VTHSQLVHIAGVMAVWVIFLSAVRFAAAGSHGLRPVAACLWHLMHCPAPNRADCRRRLLASLDRQYSEMLIAITTPWSVTLLFLGVVLLGGGLSLGSLGDVVQLVARSPNRLEGFDRGLDLGGAVLMCSGMAGIHAAITKRRSLSFLTSCCFAVTGLGIGVVTAVHP